MRWIWIATGLIMVVLAAAVVFRSAPPPPAIAPATEETAGLPQPLDAGDIAQLIALRNELGGALPGDDSRANSATFEQELRELAGLPQTKPSVGEALSEPPADPLNVLRDAAVALEALAAQDENAADYAAADERRLLADQLRRVARLLPNEELRTAENPPQSADPPPRLD